MLDADGMFQVVRNSLRQLGFVSILLLALVVAMPVTQAEACEPDRETSQVVALANAPDACPIDDCQDCGVACADGCCHAPAVGVMNGAMAGMTSPRFESPVAWTDVLDVPLGERSGLKRPPRA